MSCLTPGPARKKRLIIFLTGAVLMTGIPAFAMEDTIIAVVNDEVITMRDLHEFLDSRYSQMRLEGRPLAEIQTIMKDLQVNGLEALIDDKLLLTEANRKGIEVLPEAIERRMSEIKTGYANDKEFTDALVSNGNSISDMRKKIEDQLKIKFLVDDHIRSRIVVNPQEVTDFYTAYQDNFNKPERIRLDSIFIPSAKNPQAAKAKAAEALEKIRGGEDFKTIAKEYSKMPSIGTIKKGQMIGAIEDAVFGLKDGEVSEVIETDTGVYIFKALEHLPSEHSELEEVKERVTQIIYQQKYRQKFQTWLDKLKDAAYIEFKENISQ